ncbi:MAG: recombination mediator RecR, partial [Henriciella sp.]
MSQKSAGPEILKMIELIAKLPGFGPRSARRAALHLLKRRDQLLMPLADALADAGQKIERCNTCGNYDTLQPCAVCQSTSRDETVLCVVEDVPDLWALERASAFRGRYHVLGGVLSPLDGVEPEDLTIGMLVDRIGAGGIREVIFALSATLDGQITVDYVKDQLDGFDITITR